MYSGNVLNACMQSILVYDNNRPRGKYRCFFDVLYFFNVDFQFFYKCCLPNKIFLSSFLLLNFNFTMVDINLCFSFLFLDI